MSRITNTLTAAGITVGAILGVAAPPASAATTRAQQVAQLTATRPDPHRTGADLVRVPLTQQADPPGVGGYNYTPKAKWYYGANGACKFRVKQDLYTRIYIEILNDSCQSFLALASCFFEDEWCSIKAVGADWPAHKANKGTYKMLLPSEYRLCYLDLYTWRDPDEARQGHRYLASSGSFTRFV